MIPVSVNLDSFPVQRWARKGHMPSHLRGEGRRIVFRFEIAWCAIDENNDILLTDGRRMRTITLCLKTPGCVIGTSDLQAASHKDWAYEWQVACADHHIERFNLFTRQCFKGRHEDSWGMFPYSKSTEEQL